MADTFIYSPPTEPWLDILYQDKDIIVLNKPSGLLTNPGRGPHLADCLLSRVQAEFALAQLVHRLDLSTSGIVVIALRRKAERELKRQFAERIVKKRYLAVVAGHLAADSGSIDLPLTVDVGNEPRQKVCKLTGKTALTHYRVLQALPSASLLELLPVTGRSHQLRVHMLALGHPILGDAFYATEQVQAAAPRLLLHAANLQLQQPYSGETLQFTADTDFVSASGSLNWPVNNF
ncbi:MULTISPECIES: RluA family pseudouridine synthase [unclassified Arsukibacterium]|uniref:RluA family pseudouridine synthase n=1 Tax=unclassified Arsukibacterium TaxID=2635278 RepID=UPI000C89349E|nr:MULTISPECIES: RluA family pseudouridine synthase [unclassified Arsukibacterium]MAA96513.1 RNA pseudouridine synthase [Rheinheimera sp.]HAW94214.1 RNA pseudouridine synthase [Candidatus Azambacteria bacterium]|tara:strand:+ start:199 stop:900 length:702 start_codon:yes stop_codon:yes gene_type:complete